MEQAQAQEAEEFNASLSELGEAEEEAQGIVEKALQEKEKTVMEARNRAQEILEKAREKAAAEKNGLIKEAEERFRKKCDAILAEAEEEAARLKKNALKKENAVVERLFSRLFSFRKGKTGRKGR